MEGAQVKRVRLRDCHLSNALVEVWGVEFDCWFLRVYGRGVLFFSAAGAGLLVGN